MVGPGLAAAEDRAVGLRACWQYVWPRPKRLLFWVLSLSSTPVVRHICIASLGSVFNLAELPIQ